MVGLHFIAISILQVTSEAAVPFYKQCFDAWSDLNTKAPAISFQEVVNEINNSAFRRNVFSMGF